MIVNNYRAMTLIHDMAQRPLTTDDVLLLHRVVTEDTLDRSFGGRPAATAGRGPRRRRWIRTGPSRGHTPPPATELPDRLAAMVQFANGEGITGFMHPVIRAIILHLWLAYDHPFEDGNGQNRPDAVLPSDARERRIGSSNT